MLFTASPLTAHSFTKKNNEWIGIVSKEPSLVFPASFVKTISPVTTGM